jgi:hypothetical protein
MAKNTSEDVSAKPGRGSVLGGSEVVWVGLRELRGINKLYR